MGFAWKTLVLCGALTVCLPSAGAGTLYVDDNAPSGGNGGSWETAYTFLQDALTAAVSGDEIRVAQGTYYPDCDAAHPTGTGERWRSFPLKNGVALVGGYAGLGAPEPNERRIAAYVTILSGNIGTPESIADNSYHVVQGGNSGARALVDGFTITGGNADDGGGGGVRVDYCPTTLANCTITGNRADYGAGVQCGNPMDCATRSLHVLTNCTISANCAKSDGGGLWCFDSPQLTNCTIVGNTGGGVFCAIFLPPAGATVTDGVLADEPTLTNCIVWDNAPYAIDFVTSEHKPIATYCDVQGGYFGTGNRNVSPCFAFPNDPRLLDCSPCIDAGTNTPPEGLLPTDSDGQPRLLDGNGDGSALADMGAYEFNRTTETLALSATVLTITARAGQTASRTLEVRDSGLGTFAWEVQCEADWLTAAPPTGQNWGEVDTVTLTADTANLALGAYSTTVWVHATQACNTPRPVTVVLYVNTTLHVPSEYPTIQAAIDAALPGDEVVIADGLYTGTGNKYLNYYGQAITVRSASGNPAACIIDCEGSGRGFDFQSGETAAAIVQDLTIRNGNAGAVECTNSSPTLINCAITGNSAGSNSGAVNCIGWAANPTLVNCTIMANQGRGLRCSSHSSPTLTDCIFVGNQAGEGSAVFCSVASPTVTNCTFVSNAGHALYCEASTPGPKVTNCIFWPSSAIHSATSSRPVVAYCDVQGSWSGGNINADPLFVRNPSPGQDGQWGTSDDDYGDLHLTPDSPCIDATDNAAVPAGITTDLDGNPRFADTCRPHTGSGTPPIVDMGVYEAPGVPWPWTDCNVNRVIDTCDILAGTSVDTNGNGVPDECELCRGDMNCDGAVDFGDINPFVLYLSNQPLWQSTYPGCDPEHGDLNFDGAYPSYGDINEFVALLSTHPLPLVCEYP